MSERLRGDDKPRYLRFGDSSPVLFIVNDQCWRCKHLHKHFAACDAFPDFMEGGIPNDLYTGKVLHDKPYPGDNGILFEPKEEAKKK